MVLIKCVICMTKIKIEESEEDVSSEPRRLRLVVVLFSVLLCIFAGAAGYFYYKYKKAAQITNTKDEIAQLVETLDVMLDLPADETPTLATVTDKEKLTGHPFFRKSENGDKVLIYTNAGRAILYRPSIGKIVDIIAINIQDDQVAKTETREEEEKITESESTSVSEVILDGPAKVAFLNGSTKIGVTQEAEEKILAAFPDGVVVVGKEKASRSTYQGITVTDISGRASARASEIATTLGGVIGTFPAEEIILGEADIIVIIGNTGTVMSADTASKPNTKDAVFQSIDMAPQEGTAVQQ